MRYQSCAFSRCVAASCALVFALACSKGDSDSAYAPGLGEIMTLNQIRHAKLWWAAQAGNWPLAEYEVNELEEGFKDAVHFHPTHKTSSVSLAEVIPVMTSSPMRSLRSAIEAKDVVRFAEAYDSLTKACNSCHQATNFGFNVVTRPTGNTFLHQNFAPPPKEN
jgi:hypothetical protein